MSLGPVAIRILHFWATAVCVGGAGLLLRLGPARPAGTLALLRAAAVLAGLTGALWFAATFADIAGGLGALARLSAWTDFLAAPFGPPWGMLLALSIAAAGAGLAARPAAVLLAGIALAIDQAWLGHAAAGSGTFGVVMLASAATHILAGFAWVGALTMISPSLRSGRGLAEALEIVSGLGLFVVALILASGCVNVIAHVGDLAALATTPYGRILVAKIGLVAMMLGLAAFNRRATRRGHGNARLAASVAAETGLGLVVLVLAAVLGTTEPPI